MSLSSSVQNSVFSISTVSEMTGVNAITLRAWERRYGLLNPTRTEAGHRLYSAEDIEQIKQILGLLDQGISIGRVTSALDNITQQEEVIQEDGP